MTLALSPVSETNQNKSEKIGIKDRTSPVFGIGSFHDSMRFKFFIHKYKLFACHCIFLATLTAILNS